MNNNKFNKSQILMLSLLAALLFITPLLSSSLKPTYIYLIINLLIIALGAEAGLLSVFSNNPPEESKKQYSSSVSAEPVMVTKELVSSDSNNKVVISASPGSEKKSNTVVEKSTSGSHVKVVDTNDKVKKCPSMPSLFFIGGGETEAAQEEVLAEHNHFAAELAEEEEEEEEEEVLADKVLSGQELFTKAENFIGNFYKQLKMQREESWQKIHGFYQKAFE